jgi:hypothetical protein
MWRLSPCSQANNPDNKLVAKHARSFKQITQLQIFSKIYLIKGYHQIPVAAEDSPETAIFTLFGLFAYMDNSQVGSPDEKRTSSTLKLCFATNYLAINMEKCFFAVPTLEILAHTILAAGLAPMTEHTAAIDASPPSGYQPIAMFLGMVNFYCCFLPGCARIL